jgi:hypothetical protein
MPRSGRVKGELVVGALRRLPASKGHSDGLRKIAGQAAQSLCFILLENFLLKL